jgi:TolB protein
MTYRTLATVAILSMALAGCARPDPISNVRQLTFRDMGLTKSGEAYFSPDAARIIFQAYPEGEDEYQMFTLELNPDGTARRETLKQVSPGGGACTCGYFHPDGRSIIFGSSCFNPDMENPHFNRYQREGSDYTWNMPGGMDIIAADIDGSNPRQLTDTFPATTPSAPTAATAGASCSRAIVTATPICTS